MKYLCLYKRSPTHSTFPVLRFSLPSIFLAFPSPILLWFSITPKAVVVVDSNRATKVDLSSTELHLSKRVSHIFLQLIVFAYPVGVDAAYRERVTTRRRSGTTLHMGVITRATIRRSSWTLVCGDGFYYDCQVLETKKFLRYPEHLYGTLQCVPRDTIKQKHMMKWITCRSVGAQEVLGIHIPSPSAFPRVHQ